MSEGGIEKFFTLARERYNILQKRKAGLPKPWSNDLIFQQNRFCNVRREDDRTTIWFRENIRDEVKEDARKALLAIAAFRWFNKIETGEKIKPYLIEKWNSEKVQNILTDVHPVVTGAYIIKTPNGMNKLNGVLWCIDRFIEMIDSERDWYSHRHFSMEIVCGLLQKCPFLGRFMAYQICADARFTCLLKDAYDINTWAQPGPGSTRGVGRVFYNSPDKFKYGSAKDENEIIMRMIETLEISKDSNWWPKEHPELELQDIQNWFCEVDKYYRAEEGGRMKRKYGNK